MKVEWVRIEFRDKAGECVYASTTRPGLMIDVTALYISIGTENPDWTISFHHDIIHSVEYQGVKQEEK